MGGGFEKDEEVVETKRARERMARTAGERVCVCVCVYTRQRQYTDENPAVKRSSENERAQSHKVTPRRFSPAFPLLRLPLSFRKKQAAVRPIPQKKSRPRGGRKRGQKEARDHSKKMENGRRSASLELQPSALAPQR